MHTRFILVHEWIHASSKKFNRKPKLQISPTMDYYFPMSNYTTSNSFSSSSAAASASSTVPNSSILGKGKKKGGSGGRSKGGVKLSTDPQSVAARERRHRISDRFKILQSLVPGGTKMDTVSMLDEAIHYVKFLKAQIWIHQNMMMMNSSNLVDHGHGHDDHNLPLAAPAAIGVLPDDNSFQDQGFCYSNANFTGGVSQASPNIDQLGFEAEDQNRFLDGYYLKY